MRLDIKEQFGPFNALDACTLADFAVLTGANGSGKTQLLNAIDSGLVTVELDGVQLPANEILYVPSILSPQITTTYQIQQAVSVEQQVDQMRHDNRANGQLLNGVASLLGKSTKDLLPLEIKAFTVGLQRRKEDGPFTLDLARESMAYLRTHKYQMEAKHFQSIEGDQSLAALIQEERLVKNRPAPWRMVNNVLQPFGFQLIGPDVTLAAAESDLKLMLLNSAGDAVPPGALSGGERALVALALAQYVASSGTSFPRLLLLDESFSSLHPLLAKRALNTLQSVFVEGNSTRVILVTHSPTVVALAPRNAVFHVENTKPTLKVQRVSTDFALGLLTEGVPTLRVDIANQRQVLVEAPQDQLIYSSLYSTLARHLHPDVSLQFIACGKKTDGGSSRVEYLLNEFRSKGAVQVHGVLDWDATRTSSIDDGLHVLGVGERYAIENVLLDPMIVALLLSQKQKGRDQLPNSYSLPEILNLNALDRQALVDHVADRIQTASSRTNLDSTRIEVKYTSGQALLLPKWVLHTRGHDYAKWVLTAFPMLNAYAEGPNNEPEDRLVAYIAMNFAVNAANWIPQVVQDLFRLIQETNATT